MRCLEKWVSEMDKLGIAIVIGLLFSALVITILKLELIMKSLSTQVRKKEPKIESERESY